jgi:hypothetical protein
MGSREHNRLNNSGFLCTYEVIRAARLGSPSLCHPELVSAAGFDPIDARIRGFDEVRDHDLDRATKSASPHAEDTLRPLMFFRRIIPKCYQVIFVKQFCAASVEIQLSFFGIS